MSQKPQPTSTEETVEKGHQINVAKLVLAGLLLVIALIFIFSNLTKATLSFLGISLSMPGWVWFLALLAVGVVIGSLFPWLRPRRHKQR